MYLHLVSNLKGVTGKILTEYESNYDFYNTMFSTILSRNFQYAYCRFFFVGIYLDVDAS